MRNTSAQKEFRGLWKPRPQAHLVSLGFWVTNLVTIHATLTVEFPGTHRLPRVPRSEFPALVCRAVITGRGQDHVPVIATAQYVRLFECNVLKKF